MPTRRLTSRPLAPLHRLTALGLVALTLACDVGGSADDAGDDTIDDPADATVEGCDQAADFLDVRGASAGPGYADPELSVGCTDDQVLVESNGIINYAFDPVTPNPLTATDRVWAFPRYPEPAGEESPVPLGGVIAVAVNGMPIFGPTEAPQDGYRDPLLDAILDYCNGHTAPGGVYHYHARPDCLFEDLEGNTSLVIGYALDGYPILAPYVCDDAACTSVSKVESSWQRVADQFDGAGDPLYDGVDQGSWDIHTYVEGSGDLDRCNGRALAGGGYAYYSTDTFPYFIGCYHGTPLANSLGGGGGGGGGEMPPPGAPTP